MSKEHEHTIANEIDDITGPEIRAYRCGFSGSSKHPQPDILVTTATQDYAIEAKGPIASDRCYVEEDDIEQLVACQNSYTAPVLLVSFSNREAVVVRYFEKVSTRGEGVVGDDYNDLSPAEKFAALLPDAFDANVTGSGNLSLTKPSLDDWRSAQAGQSDAESFLSDLGIYAIE